MMKMMREGLRRREDLGRDLGIGRGGIDGIAITSARDQSLVRDRGTDDEGRRVVIGLVVTRQNEIETETTVRGVAKDITGGGTGVEVGQDPRTKGGGIATIGDSVYCLRCKTHLTPTKDEICDNQTNYFDDSLPHSVIVSEVVKRPNHQEAFPTLRRGTRGFFNMQHRRGNEMMSFTCVANGVFNQPFPALKSTRKCTHDWLSVTERHTERR